MKQRKGALRLVSNRRCVRPWSAKFSPTNWEVNVTIIKRNMGIHYGIIRENSSIAVKPPGDAIQILLQMWFLSWGFCRLSVTIWDSRQLLVSSYDNVCAAVCVCVCVLTVMSHRVTLHAPRKQLMHVSALESCSCGCCLFLSLCHNNVLGNEWPGVTQKCHRLFYFIAGLLVLY